MLFAGSGGVQYFAFDYLQPIPIWLYQCWLTSTAFKRLQPPSTARSCLHSSSLSSSASCLPVQVVFSILPLTIFNQFPFDCINVGKLQLPSNAFNLLQPPAVPSIALLSVPLLAVCRFMWCSVCCLWLSSTNSLLTVSMLANFNRLQPPSTARSSRHCSSLSSSASCLPVLVVFSMLPLTIFNQFPLDCIYVGKLQPPSTSINRPQFPPLLFSQFLCLLFAGSGGVQYIAFDYLQPIPIWLYQCWQTSTAFKRLQPPSTASSSLHSSSLSSSASCLPIQVVFSILPLTIFNQFPFDCINVGKLQLPSTAFNLHQPPAVPAIALLSVPLLTVCRFWWCSVCCLWLSSTNSLLTVSMLANFNRLQPPSTARSSRHCSSLSSSANWMPVLVMFSMLPLTIFNQFPLDCINVGKLQLPSTSINRPQFHPWLFFQFLCLLFAGSGGVQYIAFDYLQPIPIWLYQCWQTSTAFKRLQPPSTASSSLHSSSLSSSASCLPIQVVFSILPLTIFNQFPFDCINVGKLQLPSTAFNLHQPPAVPAIALLSVPLLTECRFWWCSVCCLWLPSTTSHLTISMLANFNRLQPPSTARSSRHFSSLSSSANWLPVLVVFSMLPLTTFNHFPHDYINVGKLQPPSTSINRPQFPPFLVLLVMLLVVLLVMSFVVMLLM